MSNNIYSYSDAIIFNFDVTNELSFLHIKDYLNSSKDCGKKIIKILVGNRIDFTDIRVISKERMEHFARKEGIKCFEVSSQNGINIDFIFYKLVKLILANRIKGEIEKEFLIKISKDLIFEKHENNKNFFFNIQKYYNN